MYRLTQCTLYCSTQSLEVYRGGCTDSPNVLCTALPNIGGIQRRIYRLTQFTLYCSTQSLEVCRGGCTGSPNVLYCSTQSSEVRREGCIGSSNVLCTALPNHWRYIEEGVQVPAMYSVLLYPNIGGMQRRMYILRVVSIFYISS